MCLQGQKFLNSQIRISHTDKCLGKIFSLNPWELSSTAGTAIFVPAILATHSDFLGFGKVYEGVSKSFEPQAFSPFR